jgi:hypothetical protein
VQEVQLYATVYDSRQRMVTNLARNDFVVYEDNQPVEITNFSADRTPVSLGIVLDTSGSMLGEKIQAARQALEQFLDELLDPDGEAFLYRFSDQPVLLQGWTSDREAIVRALGRIVPDGGTAMYDAVAEAVPLASRGRNQKKALVVISDGNDTSSYVDVRTVNQRVRASELLVYAIGIDGDAPRVPFSAPPPRRPPVPRGPSWPFPRPRPFPIPGGRFPAVSGQCPAVSGQFGGPQRGPFGRAQGADAPVNVAALREMTDDSGGRTEVVRDARDLYPATRSISDELSHQYSLGYSSNAPKDHKWHTIRVEVRSGDYHVRYRRGYIAE